MTVESISRPRGYEPGLPFLGTGIERYPVPGGGVTVIVLAQGDSIEVIDPQGLQRCEVTVFAKDGREDPAALGIRTSGPAKGIAAILSGAGEDAPPGPDRLGSAPPTQVPQTRVIRRCHGRI